MDANSDPTAGSGNETMDEGMPPAAPSDNMPAPKGKAPTLCVPLDVLATANEENAMETPEAGDKSQANIEYTVDRIEGDKAYITVDALNGQELEANPDDASEGDGDGDEDEQYQQLQDMASNMPANS